MWKLTRYTEGDRRMYQLAHENGTPVMPATHDLSRVIGACRDQARVSEFYADDAFGPHTLRNGVRWYTLPIFDGDKGEMDRTPVEFYV